MKRNDITSIIPTALFAVILAYLLLSGAECSISVLDGCNLFIQSIFPTLFPFFVLSSFAVSTGIAENIGRPLEFIPKLLGINSGRYIYLTSVLSGYPTSSKMISEGYLAGNIAKRDAMILSVLCSNGSAAFIVSFIGKKLYSDTRIALIILIANYLAPIITAYLMSLNCPDLPAMDHTSTISRKNEPSTYLSSFVSAVTGSLGAVMNVGGFIIIFSVINNMIRKFAPEGPFYDLAFSFLELSDGCGRIFSSALSADIKVSVTAGLVCFGGICVMFQNLAFMEKTDLNIKSFVRYKIFSGITGGIIAYFLCAVFKIADSEVSATMYDMNIAYTEANILLLAGFIIIILYTIINRQTEENNEHKRYTDTGGKSS